MINPVRNGDVSAAFQYRERYVEGCNAQRSLRDAFKYSFNTENGMWRAAIRSMTTGLKWSLLFQYRERYVEGCNMMRR